MRVTSKEDVRRQYQSIRRHIKSTPIKQNRIYKPILEKSAKILAKSIDNDASQANNNNHTDKERGLPHRSMTLALG